MSHNQLSVKQIRPDEQVMGYKQIRNREIHDYFLDPNSGALRSNIATSIRCTCGTSAAPAFAFEIRGFSFVRCPECSLLYVNPRPTIGALGEYFKSAEGMSYFQTEILERTAAVRRERIFRPRCEWLKNSIAPKGGRLLDVGCSVGLFLECFSGDEQFSVAGIEPNYVAAEICRKKGFEVWQTTVEEFDTDETFDVVTGWDFIRHVVEPFEVLSRLYQIVTPGGILILTTANVTGFDFVLLGDEHDNITPPLLLNGFTPLSIQKALERVGFEIVELSTPGQLDVEIVREYWLAGGQNGRNAFLEQIMLTGTETQRSAFQDYLRENGLSSRLRVAARK